jgi:hypothetical protein
MRLIFALLLIPVLGISQEYPIDKETGKITYQVTKEIEGKGKNDLYLSALEWFATSYKDANEVIQFKDQESGKVIGRALMRLPNALSTVSLFYNITVEVKDGKYRATVTDLYFQSSPTYGFNLEDQPPTMIGKKAFCQRVNIEVMTLLKGLHEEMKKAAPVDEDW